MVESVRVTVTGPAGSTVAGRSSVTLMVRASTAEVMQRPYIRTAILKGLPQGGAPTDRMFKLSNMALLMTLRRMKRDDLTAHGFRSSERRTEGDAAIGHQAKHLDVAETGIPVTVGGRTGSIRVVSMKRPSAAARVAQSRSRRM